MKACEIQASFKYLRIGELNEGFIQEDIDSKYFQEMVFFP
jgi:hypothetical protein